MLEFARWKYVVAAIVLLFSAIYSLPNLYPQDPAVQISARRGADIDAALAERVRSELERQELPFKSVEEENGSLLVRLLDANEQNPAAAALRTALGDDYVVAVNLASTVPQWLQAIGADPMVLGLDLLGGVQFLMEVDQKAVIDQRMNSVVDDIRGLLRDNRVGYAGVDRQGDDVLIKLREAADRGAAYSLIARDIPELQLVDGESPDTLVARLSETVRRDLITQAIEQNISTLGNRINELGVAEPVIQRQGAQRISVQLPGVQDTAQAKKILGATATLEWRAVVGDSMSAAFDAAQSGRVPPDARLYYQRDPRRGDQPIPVLLSKRVIVTGDQLVTASSGFDAQSGGPMVSITLNNVGGQRMFDHTSENVGKQMGVVFIERVPETKIVDGKEVRTARITEDVISVATTQGVFGKRFQITGLESSTYASELALLMRAGALAAPIDIVEERVIGPSLGKENIEKGWKAVSYSFLFVLAFFLVYYKTFGIVTNLALLLNLLMLVAVMSMMGATLTLPGLAGIALTVGMSVDANVLINERIREELRAGNTPLASIAAGYDKASGTIADANVTAMLAGVALFAFGSGPIQGFAVSLVVGILTSMYTAVSVSRGIATLIYGRRRKVARVSI